MPHPGSEGWQPLPFGGYVRVLEEPGGRRVEVSDGGMMATPEEVILVQTAAATNLSLSWSNWERSRRWRPSPLLGSIFSAADPPGSRAWLSIDPCRSCGERVGTRWHATPRDEPIWVCEPCHQEFEEEDRAAKGGA